MGPGPGSSEGWIHCSAQQQSIPDGSGGAIRCPWAVRRRAVPGSANVPRVGPWPPLRLYFAAPGTARRLTGADWVAWSTLQTSGAPDCSAQQQSIPDGSGGVLCAAKSRRKAGTAGLGDIRGAEYPGAPIGPWLGQATQDLGCLLGGSIAARPSAGGAIRCP